jgi:hypothetical protein
MAVQPGQAGHYEADRPDRPPVEQHRMSNDLDLTGTCFDKRFLLLCHGHRFPLLELLTRFDPTRSLLCRSFHAPRSWAKSHISVAVMEQGTVRQVIILVVLEPERAFPPEDSPWAERGG